MCYLAVEGAGAYTKNTLMRLISYVRNFSEAVIPTFLQVKISRQYSTTNVADSSLPTLHHGITFWRWNQYLLLDIIYADR